MLRFADEALIVSILVFVYISTWARISLRKAVGRLAAPATRLNSFPDPRIAGRTSRERTRKQKVISNMFISWPSRHSNYSLSTFFMNLLHAIPYLLSIRVNIITTFPARKCNSFHWVVNLHAI